MPLVSVVLPVRNGGRFLRPAIDSVLRQTFDDFELLIVDGGSTDGSVELVRGMARQDARVRLLLRPGLNLPQSLNAGCQEARGRYVARMDADDVSEPSRFASQVAFLDAHEDVAVVGSHFIDVDEHGNSADVYKVQTSPDTTRWILLFGSCFAHPTVMMRRDVVARYNFYDEKAQYSEDYDLWSRMVATENFSNVEECLLRRRVWHGNKGNADGARNEAFNSRLMHRVLTSILPIQRSVEDVEALRRLLGGGTAHSASEPLQAARLLGSMADAYLMKYRPSRVDRSIIAANAAQKILILARSASRHSRLASLRIAAMAVRRHAPVVNSANMRKAWSSRRSGQPGTASGEA